MIRVGFAVRLLLAALVCVGFVTLPRLAAEDAGGPPLSARNANYTIWVKLDAAAKTLEGREVLEWRNDTTATANDLWFHLYWNAWRDQKSSWMREDALRATPRSRPDRKRPEDYASMDVTAVKLLGAAPMPGGAPAADVDLTAQMRFASPDDGNPDDRTVLVVPLPQAVKPRDTIRVEITWKSKIPRTFARTGRRGNYFFLAQWFPKLAVFQDDGTWNGHQFHAATEFFSDYGVYDVQMTVPQGWLLGATGVELGVTQNSDGTATHRYQQADVHDFTWTTSPDYREARRRFEHPGLKAVDMRLLYQPEHEGQVDRHFAATEAALRYYGTWFGEYPYGHVTVVDPAYESGSGGMEYPTLFTCGTRFWNLFGGGSPEGVTVHEAGHQFWYGLVGNNEFEYAWIDEGLNTFSEDRVQEVAYGPHFFVRRMFREFVPVALRDVRRNRILGTGINRYRDHARRDVQATPTYQYHPASASSITYSKTGLWLMTLERTLGWETLQRILSTFFQRWKFRHPTPADFIAVANEASGQDLTHFFDQVFFQAAVFDFSVESVESRPLRAEGAPADAPSPAYETRVVVRRLEDGQLPVEVLLKFENGEEVREVWEAKDLWKLYTVTKPAKLEYAAVDPEHKIVLDVNYTNNTRRLRSQASLAATKWAAKWMLWLQEFLQSLAFLG